MNNDYGVSHKITREGLLKMFWTCLTSSSIGFGCIELDYDRNAYLEVRDELRKKEKDDCWEDIVVEMLRQGYRLAWIDVEEDDFAKRNWFTLDDLIDNFDNIESHHLADLLGGEDDAVTHDSILQCLLMGEIVYG
jgi:hypothetical protein